MELGSYRGSKKLLQVSELYVKWWVVLAKISGVFFTLFYTTLKYWNTIFDKGLGRTPINIIIFIFILHVPMILYIGTCTYSMCTHLVWQHSLYQSLVHQYCSKKGLVKMLCLLFTLHFHCIVHFILQPSLHIPFTSFLTPQSLLPTPHSTALSSLHTSHS